MFEGAVSCALEAEAYVGNTSMRGGADIRLRRKRMLGVKRGRTSPTYQQD